MLIAPILTKQAPLDPVGSPFGWWKANAVVASDGDHIPNYPDASGNGIVGTGGGTQNPIWNSNILNGLPAMTFSGSNWFEITGITPTGQLSIFTVVNEYLGLSNSSWFGAAKIANPDGGLNIGPFAGNLLCQTGAGTGGWPSGTNNTSVVAIAANTWYILELRIGATSTIINLNGTQVLNDGSHGTIASATVSLALGALHRHDIGFVGGMIARSPETIYYNSDIGATLAAGNRAYLKAKYNL